MGAMSGHRSGPGPQPSFLVSGTAQKASWRPAVLCTARRLKRPILSVWGLKKGLEASGGPGACEPRASRPLCGGPALFYPLRLPLCALKLCSLLWWLEN